MSSLEDTRQTVVIWQIKESSEHAQSVGIYLSLDGLCNLCLRGLTLCLCLVDAEGQV
jgi:hypothetical protein